MIQKKVREVLKKMEPAAGIFFILIGWAVTAFVIVFIQKRKPKELGFIPQKEMRPTRTFTEKILKQVPNGFVFGKDQYATHDWIIKPENKDGHIMIVGGPGTGKTTCLAIPSMMSWKNRIFAIDIKGELYAKSGRPMVRVFNPLDHNALGYDPFFVLRNSKNIVQEIRKISLSLIPIPAEVKDQYWLQGAQNLLTSGLIHYHHQDLTFIECIEKIQTLAVGDLVNELANSEVSEAKILASQFIDANVKELRSFKGEVSQHIVDFILDPDIRQSFSKSSSECVKPTDLERGCDVFLQIPEHKLDQWGRILSLITSQFLDHFEKRDEATAQPILFLLDEFPRLGKFGNIANGLATLRSKKITMAIIIQSLAQLDYIYGEAQRQVIADNCAYKAVLGASEPKTQEYFSKLVGTYMAVRTTFSSSTSSNPAYRIEDEDGIFGGTYGRYKEYGTAEGTTHSSSTSEQRENVMQPHEFGALADIVLLVSGKNGGYFRVDKTPYYDPQIAKELQIDGDEQAKKAREQIEAENKKIAYDNLKAKQENQKIMAENANISRKNEEIVKKRKMLTAAQIIIGCVGIFGFFGIGMSIYQTAYNDVMRQVRQNFPLR